MTSEGKGKGITVLDLLKFLLGLIVLAVVLGVLALEINQSTEEMAELEKINQQEIIKEFNSIMGTKNSTIDSKESSVEYLIKHGTTLYTVSLERKTDHITRILNGSEIIYESEGNK